MLLQEECLQGNVLQTTMPLLRRLSAVLPLQSDQSFYLMHVASTGSIIIADTQLEFFLLTIFCSTFFFNIFHFFFG